MIFIGYNQEYCDISVEYPITDKDVDKLISLPFGDLVKTGNIVEDGLELEDDGISLDEFIKTKLTPEQQERVQNYIYQELEKINERFYGLSQVKSARSSMPS